MVEGTAEADAVATLRSLSADVVGAWRKIATSSASPARWTWASSHLSAVARRPSPGEQRVALDRLRRLLGQEAAGEALQHDLQQQPNEEDADIGAAGLPDRRQL